MKEIKMKTKVCSRCKKVKGLEEFYKDKNVKDGREAQCKACRSETHTKYRATPAGKAVQAKGQAKYAKTPAGKAVQAKGQAKYAKTPAGKATAARSCTRYQQRMRVKALEFMGSVCASFGCSQDLHGIAWGAHHKTPRSITGREKINWSWSWPHIKKELLNDMELLCIPCHRATKHMEIIRSFEGVRAAMSASEKLMVEAGF